MGCVAMRQADGEVGHLQTYVEMYSVRYCLIFIALNEMSQFHNDMLPDYKECKGDLVLE